MNFTFSKLVAATLALVMVATSAFADCLCQTKGGIPASALLPSIPFGQDIVIGNAPQATHTVKPARIKVAKPPKVAANKPAKAVVPQASAAAGAKLNCLTTSGTGAWSIQWVREGNGRCPGQILVSDTNALVALANKGITSFRLAFYIPEKCPASKWASMPASADKNTRTIKIFPWRKVCSAKGHFTPYAK
jgi:hypothetical protein